MTDKRIVELFFARDQRAITEVQKKYSDYCYTVAHNILGNREDAEECVSDSYLAAWNSIPPEKPKSLGAYLAKLTRNFALTRYRTAHRQKRAGVVTELTDELASTLPDGYDVAAEYDAGRTSAVIDGVLRGLSARDRRVCMLRYFYGESHKRIASEMGIPESTVGTILQRSREKIAKALQKEGILI